MQRALSGMRVTRREERQRGRERESGRARTSVHDGVGNSKRRGESEIQAERKKGGSCVHSAVGLFLPAFFLTLWPDAVHSSPADPVEIALAAGEIYS